MARAETKQSQELQVSYASLTWIQQPNHLGHPLLLFQAHQQGLGPKAEQPEIELVCIWNGSTSGNSLTVYTTEPTPWWILKLPHTICPQKDKSLV